MSVKETLHISLDDIEEGLHLIVDAKRINTLFDVADANEHGEVRYQLVEGFTYDYEFSNSEFSFRKEQIVQPHSRKKHLGTISPNIYVGTLTLPVLKKEKEVGQTAFEVRSVKAKYREDYRFMLEFITEKCTDLLLQSSSPVKQHFTSDYLKDSKTLYQRFAFIQSIIQTVEFSEAIQRIIGAPVTRWKESIETADVRKIKRISGKETRQIASGRSRMNIPKGHSLHNAGLISLPTHVLLAKKTDTVDTTENRFVKHALEVFLKLCLDIELKTKKETRLNAEVNTVINTLESHLHHSIFKEISRPATLRLNSPVLQKREGYREVLRAWLMFDLAALLVWKGGDDVYDAGKRDVATLYEYWLFFTLLDLFSELFNLNPKEVDSLIVPSDDGLSLKLKQGNETAIEGIYDAGYRKLNIKFCFNRSFGGGKEYPKGGSWTKTLRPDYTLSIWPDGISENKAEEQELIVHIHFDAKYKIENLTQIIDNEEDENIVSGNIRGKYKNIDLLKMHAYKDAIRRTAGAYVLYPGDKNYEEKGFHEVIPGLGAFPIRPSKSNNGTDELKDFVKEVISHFLNLASQREKMSYRTYDIHKSDSENIVKEPLPELIGENRNLIPDETFVLVGFYERDKLDWIIKEGFYNARADNNRGSLRLGPKEAGARYLLLHTRGEAQCAGIMLKIIETGPRVFSKQTLLSKRYPTEPSQDYYLVYKVKDVIEEELISNKWDISKLESFKSGRGSGLPFAVSLTELMKVKI